MHNIHIISVSTQQKIHIKRTYGPRVFSKFAWLRAVHTSNLLKQQIEATGNRLAFNISLRHVASTCCWCVRAFSHVRRTI